MEICGNIRNTTWIITTAAAIKKQDRYYMFMDTSYQYWEYHEMTSLKTSKSIKLQQQGLAILISIRLLRELLFLSWSLWK